MQYIAQKHGGLCLSPTYENFRKKLKFRCEQGHVFETLPSNIRKGHWCRKCSVLAWRLKSKYPDEYFYDYARKRGGEIISISPYQDGQESLKRTVTYICAKGHKCETQLFSLYSGSWCQKCGHEKTTSTKAKKSYKRLLNIAKEHKGSELLSKEYLGYKVKHFWLCPIHGKFEMAPNLAFRGTWCKQCAIEAKMTQDQWYHDFAKQKNGEILNIPALKEGEYADDRIIKYICSQGHIRYVKARTLREKHWCSICAKDERLRNQENKSLIKLKKIALTKGCELISEEYLGARNISYKFKCNKHGIFTRKNLDKKLKFWCRDCLQEERTQKGHKTKYTDQWYYNFAAKRGWKILYLEPFENLGKRHIYTRKVKYICSQGHIREVKAGTLHIGSECRICSMRKVSQLKRKKAYRKAKKVISAKGGTLITGENEYIEHMGKLEIECPKHGVFETHKDGIISGHWCPSCKFEKLNKIHRKPWKEVKQIVTKHGWTLLTEKTKYVNSKKIKVTCPDGHISTRSLQAITSGKGCYRCNASRGEEISRSICEKIFNKPFPSKRPSFLKTSHGGRLELDGYNEELSIAFEYQGEQHYRAGTRSYFTQDKVIKIQKRDTLKKQLCNQNNISLIIIPAFPEKVFYDPKKVIELVELSINKAGVIMPQWQKKDFDPIKETNLTGKIKKWRHIANRVNVILHDTVWKGTKHKYSWECKNCSHTWKSSAYARKKGFGCPVCRRKAYGLSRRKYSIEYLHLYAENKDGKCMDREYKGVLYRYNWKCNKCHHKWKTSWGNILYQNTWCPKCRPFSKKKREQV